MRGRVQRGALVEHDVLHHHVGCEPVTRVEAVALGDARAQHEAARGQADGGERGRDQRADAGVVHRDARVGRDERRDVTGEHRRDDTLERRPRRRGRGCQRRGIRPQEHHLARAIERGRGDALRRDGARAERDPRAAFDVPAGGHERGPRCGTKASGRERRWRAQVQARRHDVPRGDRGPPRWQQRGESLPAHRRHPHERIGRERAWLDQERRRGARYRAAGCGRDVGGRGRLWGEPCIDGAVGHAGDQRRRRSTR